MSKEEWWKRPEDSDIECHTPRVWDQIAKAAEKAGDLERAQEAKEAGERESMNFGGNL